MFAGLVESVQEINIVFEKPSVFDLFQSDNGNTIFSTMSNLANLSGDRTPLNFCPLVTSF